MWEEHSCWPFQEERRQVPDPETGLTVQVARSQCQSAMPTARALMSSQEVRSPVILSLELNLKWPPPLLSFCTHTPLMISGKQPTCGCSGCYSQPTGSNSRGHGHTSAILGHWLTSNIFESFSVLYFLGHLVKIIILKKNITQQFQHLGVYPRSAKGCMFKEVHCSSVDSPFIYRGKQEAATNKEVTKVYSCLC